MHGYLQQDEQRHEAHHAQHDDPAAFRARCRVYAQLYLAGVDLPDNLRELAKRELECEGVRS